MKLYFSFLRTITLLPILCLALLSQINAQEEETPLERESSIPGAIYEKLDESNIPSPAVEGYKWRILPEINGAFQVPIDWHFHIDSAKGQFGYFFSKENIDQEGQYITGLSVNVIFNLKDRTGKSAVDYARDIAIDMIRSSDTLLTGATKIGTFSQYLCRSRVPTGEGSAIIVHNLLMGNSATDTFYMIIFEAPEEEWEKTDNIAEIMLTNFILDLEI